MASVCAGIEPRQPEGCSSQEVTVAGAPGRCIFERDDRQGDRTPSPPLPRRARRGIVEVAASQARVSNPAGRRYEQRLDSQRPPAKIPQWMASRPDGELNPSPSWGSGFADRPPHPRRSQVVVDMVGRRGFEPPRRSRATALQAAEPTSCSTHPWGDRRDLNPRPPGPQPGARPPSSCHSARTRTRTWDPCRVKAVLSPLSYAGTVEDVGSGSSIGSPGGTRTCTWAH